MINYAGRRLKPITLGGYHMKKKVLFICIHNSARSQMAEEYLRHMAGDVFEVESAGLEPSSINPFVIQVMQEEGIDLSHKKSQSVFELYKEQKFYGYVITVCDRAREADCPIFPGLVKRLSWDLENPADFTGTDDEILVRVRAVRDAIKNLVLDFINEYGSM
jgi:arsenate reductase